MKIYWDYFKKEKEPHTIIIGNFDGIHLGHRHLIKEAQKRQKEREKLGVITFYPHPESVLKARQDNFSLTTYDEKISLLEQLNVDTIFFIEFTSSFSKLSPEEFIKKLLNMVNIKRIIIGENFKFGRYGKGTPNLLKEKLKPLGIDVHIVKLFQMDNEVISSTLIRNCIFDMEFKCADRYLGRPYLICGNVFYGKGEGKKLGFPTANIHVQSKILPPAGVYKGTAYYENKSYFALIFIGKPTFNVDDEIIVEVWMEHFNKEIYGKELCIHIEKFIRKPKKVKNTSELKNLIQHDYKIAKNEI